MCHLQTSVCAAAAKLSNQILADAFDELPTDIAANQTRPDAVHLDTMHCLSAYFSVVMLGMACTADCGIAPVHSRLALAILFHEPLHPVLAPSSWPALFCTAFNRHAGMLLPLIQTACPRHTSQCCLTALPLRVSSITRACMRQHFSNGLQIS